MVSESTMKALKKDRFKNFCDDELNFSYLRMLPYGPHAPNKNESKKMREICSKTGLSPEDVRKIKRYRVELANASKAKGPGRNRQWKHFRGIRNEIAKNLGLHSCHPSVKKAFIEKIESNISRGYRWRYGDVTPEMAYKMSFVNFME